MAMRSLSADRIGGLIWIVFGSAVVYGSWTMDRLQSLGIPPSTAPGVVPGLLGIGIIIFGFILLVRREAAPVAAFTREPDAVPAAAPDEFHWKRAALSGVLCLIYGGALLGSGLPYWLLTMGFLFLHIVLLDETTDVPARPSLRRLVTAAVIAPTFAIVVTLVFQYIFLVRLP